MQTSDHLPLIEVDCSDISDMIAGLQVAFRTLSHLDGVEWSLTMPRVSSYLLTCYQRYVEAYPEYADLFPLPWDRFSRLPDPVLIALSVRITQGGFIEEKIGRAHIHPPAHLAGQVSTAQRAALAKVVSRGANQ